MPLVIMQKQLLETKLNFPTLLALNISLVVLAFLIKFMGTFITQHSATVINICGFALLLLELNKISLLPSSLVTVKSRMPNFPGKFLVFSINCLRSPQILPCISQTMTSFTSFTLQTDI